MYATDVTYYNPVDTEPEGKIVLVGMTADGPPHTGFTLPATTDVAALLGENELTRSYRVLEQAGIAREKILIYRLNGKRGFLTLAKDGVPYLRFHSLGAGKEDKNIQIKVQATGLVLQSNYAASDAKGFSRTYAYADYPYLSDLADAINQDALLGGIALGATELLEGAATVDYFLTEQGDYVLEGSDSEVGLCVGTDTEWTSYAGNYWIKFWNYVLGPGYDGYAQTPLTTLPCELLLFTDICLDKLPQLATFCARLAEQRTSEQQLVCTALLHPSTVPVDNTLPGDARNVVGDTYTDAVTGERVTLDPAADRTAYLSVLNGLFTEADRDNPAMRHLQVVVGDNRSYNLQTDANGEKQYTVTPGSVYYAARYLLENFHSPLSNKELPGFEQLHVQLPKTCIAELQSNGYICIVSSVRRNFVTLFAQNLAAKTGTILENFANQRFVGVVSRDIQNLLEENIGQSKTAYYLKDVSSLLTEYLNQYVTSGILSGFKILSRSSLNMFEEQVELELSLYNEVKQVKACFRVDKAEQEVAVWNQLV